jgi:AcrR family transcriptional regulator
MTLAEDAFRRLPRGSHGLTRDEVVQSQRTRIFRAMIHVMAQKGYAATSVAEVLRHAQVSRETFYEQFSSKEQCFLDAFEAAVEFVLERAANTTVPNGPAISRFDLALRSYLDTLATHPAYARLFLIEVYAAGPVALERRAALQQRFADAVNEMLGARTATDRFAVEALVAATATMVTMRLAADDAEGIRALHDPLLELVRRVRGAGGRRAARR